MKKLIVIIALVASSFNTVFGQDNPGVTRQGFVIGVGAGAGLFCIKDEGEGASFEKDGGALSLPNLKIGFMVSPKTAFLLTMPGSIYQSEGRDRSFEAIIPTIQQWVGNRLWMSAGAGLAMEMPALYDMKGLSDPQFNFGYALSGSVGFEIIQRKNYAFDIQGRVQFGNTYLKNDIERSSTAFTLGVGFNWY